MPDLAAICLAVALALVPILMDPLPPLADYPNHLARMHVIATIGSDADLARYYEIHWQIIPNLVMDVIVPALAQVTDIYHAGQAFTALCCLLLATGVFALNRALFGTWSVLGIAALPFLYNRIFLIGVMNYWFGVGLALWAATAWVLLRERAWPWRLLASAAFAAVLFFSHLFALGLYGLVLLALELRRLWHRRDIPLAARLVDFVATGLPFLPIIALLLASPTWSLAGRNVWTLASKPEGLAFVASTYSNVIDVVVVAGVGAVVAWAARRRALRVHPAAWPLLGIGAIVYLAMPNVLFDTYAADERLPVAILFAATAFIAAAPSSRPARRGLALALLLLLAIRVGEVAVNWRELSAQSQDVRASTRSIEQRGARVLVAQSDQVPESEVRDYGLAHAGCLAIIERSAFVANAFVFPGKQIMGVRPAYRRLAESVDGDLPSLEDLAEASTMAPAADGNAPYWQRWQDHFDYLYVMDTAEGAANPFPQFLVMAYSGRGFQLYRIRRPAQ